MPETAPTTDRPAATPPVFPIPEAERLAGYRITATDDGGAVLVTYSKHPDGGVAVSAYELEPALADRFRQAVTRDLPDRPVPAITTAEIQRRQEAIARALFS